MDRDNFWKKYYMKNTDIKITFSVFFSFIIVFTSLFIFLSIDNDSVNHINHFDFGPLNLDPLSKKIFLFGSSQIIRLNATLINEKVKMIDDTYTVYNLAEKGANPTDILPFIDEFILEKPAIIFYGFSYRDFNVEKIESNILPDPNHEFTKIIENIDPKLNTINPKSATLKIIRNSFQNEVIFPDDTDEIITILNDIQLRNQVHLSEAPKLHISSSDVNKRVKDMEKIISKVQDNNIKLILFVAPLNEHYLEIIPESEKNSFNLIVQELSKKYNVEIYDYSDKYVGLPIWADLVHVAYNKNAMIYSEDVAKIIINEIGK